MFFTSPVIAGSIKGVVKVKGLRTPENILVYLTKAPPVIEDLSKVKFVMDQRNLEFIPHVLPIFVGATVDFPNNDKVDHNVFNVGHTDENYQKEMLVEEMKRVIPNANVDFFPKDNDPRDFKVDFSKIKRELQWDITKTVPIGIQEMHQALRCGLISDPYSPRYREI